MEAAWMRDGKLVLLGDMGSKNTVVDEFYFDAIRNALGIPELTEDEIAWTLAERKLQQAKDDGRITNYGWMRVPNSWETYKNGSRFLYSLGLEQPNIFGPTRRDAAQAAASYIDTMPLPKPKLKPVEDMTVYDCTKELDSLGWEMYENAQATKIVIVRGDKHLFIGNGSGVYSTENYRDAVRQARIIDTVEHCHKDTP